MRDPRNSQTKSQMKFNLLVVLTLFSMSVFAQSLKTRKSIKFLALGDSYTIGESVAASARWPVQLADSLKKLGVDVETPVIIATTGWRTDDLKRAIGNAHLKNEYGMVSLLIGVNNQYQGKPVSAYPAEFRELLEMAIHLAGGKKENVFVLSIPDYGYTPYGAPNQQKISAALNEFNSVNKEVTEKAGVKYFDITGISRKGLTQPDLVAGDDLHPSANMYAEWVSIILKGLTPFK
jgi:lysophospholipase L1-like esterase